MDYEDMAREVFKRVLRREGRTRVRESKERN